MPRNRWLPGASPLDPIGGLNRPPNPQICMESLKAFKTHTALRLRRSTLVSIKPWIRPWKFKCIVREWSGRKRGDRVFRRATKVFWLRTGCSSAFLLRILPNSKFTGVAWGWKKKERKKHKHLAISTEDEENDPSSENPNLGINKKLDATRERAKLAETRNSKL